MITSLIMRLGLCGMLVVPASIFASLGTSDLQVLVPQSMLANMPERKTFKDAVTEIALNNDMTTITEDTRFIEAVNEIARETSTTPISKGKLVITKAVSRCLAYNYVNKVTAEGDLKALKRGIDSGYMSSGDLLEIATFAGNADIVNYLISTEFVHLKRESAEYILRALIAGYSMAVKYAQEFNGGNPLTEAELASTGHLACLELLVAAGLKLAVRINPAGETALQIARAKGFTVLEKKLKEQGIVCLEKMGVDLLNAIFD